MSHVRVPFLSPLKKSYVIQHLCQVGDQMSDILFSLGLVVRFQSQRLLVGNHSPQPSRVNNTHNIMLEVPL